MKEIEISKIVCNPFTLIGKEWCLIGAQNNNKFNAMTASWGSVGVLWNKNIATIYVRPQRYTREFIDSSDTFTISFFDERFRNQLNVYGTTSGRDVNKEDETGLTLIHDNDTTYFKEANLVLVCKKLYRGAIKEDEFLIADIAKTNYPQEDYHIIYIGEIVKVYGE